MDDVIKECKKKTRATQLGFWKMQPVTNSEFAFTDDLLLLTDSEEKLQVNLNIWAEELRKRNMTINIAKTKCLVVARMAKQMRIHVNGQIVEQVPNFKYLGVVISEDRKMKVEISARKTAAGKMFAATNRKILSKREVR